MIPYEELKSNYLDIQNRINAAAAACGKKPGEVLLIPAAKYAETEQLNFLHRECGMNCFGENRVQTLLEHYEGLEDKENIDIHFIGSLQKNKVKYIVGKVALIQSLDSYELALEIDRQAKKHGLVQNVLIEINSGEEESKGGVLPAGAAELSLRVQELANIKLCGFMTIGPRYADEEAAYANFLKTYGLCLDIWSEKLHNIGIPQISMGMTDSFVPAIRAGAGMVRIGRAVFGITTPVPVQDKKQK